MTEIDFLINVRRLILQIAAMLDKRIEFLRCVPVENVDEQAQASLMNVADNIRKGN